MDDLNVSSARKVKRRRGPGDITQNACTECRKRRSKCNGEKPCGRCISQGVDCNYEIQIRQSKQQMRNEIEKLRVKEKQQEILIAALLSQDYSEIALEQLRKGESVSVVSEKSKKLLSGQSFLGNNPRSNQKMNTHNTTPENRSLGILPTFIIGNKDLNQTSNWKTVSKHNTSSSKAQWEDLDKDQKDCLNHREKNQISHEIFADKTKNYFSFDHMEIETLDLYHLNSITEWTKLTTDEVWINHLVELYFCWEYPIFAPLSKDHFLEDFKLGKTRYCSSLLVNSILAVGCRFSDQPRARTNPADSNTAGDQFFAEAVRILQSEKEHSCLTTIQALNILSIREASCGRSTISLFYSGQSVRLAIEMGLHRDLNLTKKNASDLSELTVRLATFWGACSLDQTWSLSIGRQPQFSENIKSVKQPMIIRSMETSDWSPYTEEGTPCKVKLSQHNDWNVFAAFCELSEIIHRSLYTLYSPTTTVTSFKLLEAYTEHLRWYDTIPVTFRLGQDFTPAVLFSHIYYHFAILLLFRPFIKLEIINSALSPRVMCIQAGEAISTLVNSYSKLYTLRRAPTFTPYIILISTITQLMIYRDSGTGLEAVKQGILYLQMMTSSHAFSVHSLNTLCYLIKHWGMTMDIDTDENIDKCKVKIQEYLVCEKIARNKTCQVISTALNPFFPRIVYDSGHCDGSTTLIGESLSFLPFSLQGTPPLDLGYENIEESGFRVHQPG